MTYYRLMISLFIFSLGQGAMASASHDPVSCTFDSHDPVSCTFFAEECSLCAAAACAAADAPPAPISAPAASSVVWKAKFLLLQAYVHEHGHARVPQDLNTQEYPGLGGWVHCQRRAYKNSDGGRVRRKRRVYISPEQIAALEKVGFVWNVLIAAWNAKFELLIKYVLENGDARVTQAFNTQEYPGLGSWVDLQRKAYRCRKILVQGGVPNKMNRISEGQIAKLEAIGFEWDPNAADWEDKFLLLQAYIYEHGDTKVPVSLNSSSYPRLGPWVKRQRRAFKYVNTPKEKRKGRASYITEEQIERLDKLGFVWAVRKSAKSSKNLSSVRKRMRK